MKKTIYILLFLILVCMYTSSQTISRVGVKGGILFSGLTTGDNSQLIDNDLSSLNFISYDIGFYAEMFSTSTFNLSAELHYNLKGERNPNFTKFITQEETSQGTVYGLKYLSDRFHYISLQMLPRYHFILSRDETLFVQGGPVLDYLIGNSNSENDNALTVKNSTLEFAAIAGFGATINNWLILDFRFQHNFTPSYTYSYGNEQSSRYNNSAIFMVGFVLKSFKNKL
jgi:hypothetical protein